MICLAPQFLLIFSGWLFTQYLNKICTNLFQDSYLSTKHLSCTYTLTTRLTMALFVYSVPAFRLFKGSKKLLEHWRKIHERLTKLYTCTNCKKTFSSSSKAAAQLCQAGSQHWRKEIEVRNKNFMDPFQARFNQHTKELTPREVAAEERRKAITPGAEVLYYSSGVSANRDEEVVMLEDGRFMRQRKVSERKRHLLQNPPSLTIMTTPLNCEIIHSSKTVNILLIL